MIVGLDETLQELPRSRNQPYINSFLFWSS